VPEDDKGFPANGRAWNFEYSRMAWRGISGTEVRWNKSGKIAGKITGNAVIESSAWLLTDLTKYQNLVLRIKNNSTAKQAKISIASVNPKGAFWETPQINWKEQDHIIIDLEPNSNEFKEYKIDLSTQPNLKSMLKRLRIEPAIGATAGSWEIEYISVE